MTIQWMALVLLTGAQPNNFQEARQWFERGVAAMDKGQTNAAIKAFKSSLELRKSPVTLFNLGAACRKAKQYACVAESVSQFLDMTDAIYQGRDLAETWKDEAMRHIAVVELTVTGNATQVTVDGVEHLDQDGILTLRLKPGPHHFRAQRPGFEPVDRRVELTAGKTLAVSLNAAQAPLMGVLRIEVVPEQATIRIDGQTRATGRFEDRVPVGVHAVELAAQHHQSAQRSVEVHADREAHLQVSLEPAMTYESGLTEKWWFWTAIGVAVVGAAVGTTVLVTSSQKADGGSLETVVRGIRPLQF